MVGGNDTAGGDTSDTSEGTSTDGEDAVGAFVDEVPLTDVEGDESECPANDGETFEGCATGERVLPTGVHVDLVG